jgi:2-polyprenyl-6-hydroxyphenyl methylase/3-demethylubiquinone-9 3-methyltransferase
MTAAAPSLDPSEVAKFSAMAAEWWNPKGKFGVLHVFNPVRLQFIKEQVTARLARDPLEREPFKGLRFLDIGCGGGLLTEPMSRLGASITGVDPSERNIKTASVHAQEMGLDIDYRVGTAAFTRTCASMLKPGGLMFVATLNRTLKSFGLAIVGAEYVLGWLPKGTHQWEKFITPAELKGWLADNGLTVKEELGVTYSPFTRQWRVSRDMDVNYMLVAQKA